VKDAAIDSAAASPAKVREQPLGRSSRSVVEIDASRPWRRWLADLVEYRGALRSLAWRNVRSRYKQAALGVTWAVLQPMLQVAVFTVLFGLIARADSGGVPYPLFALAGLVAWNFFNKVVSDGAISLVTNQHIITKLYFPRIYVVLAAGASACLDAVVSLALLALLMVWYGVPLTSAAWMAIPAMAAIVLVSFGLAALLAAINARWRDVQHTLPFFLQIGMFLTPVVYRPELVPERWRWLLALNPLAGLIEVFRSSLLGLPMPPARLFATSAVIALASIIGGIWYFRRSEVAIVDVV
jgi:lipopolysaccharide transport system permease protein